MPTTLDAMGWRMTEQDQDPRITWMNWINAQFDAKPGTKQQDVARAARVGNSAVTKWRKGVNTAEADAAGRVAVFFGRSPVEAMRAAGHYELLDLLGVGDRDESIVDPIAAEIMSWTYLGIKVRQALLERYRADTRAALEEARAMADRMRNDDEPTAQAS